VSFPMVLLLVPVQPARPSAVVEPGWTGKGARCGVLRYGVPRIREDSGLYVVLVDVVRPVHVRWAGSGTVLPSGTYVYVGSARRCLRARVERHFRRQKPKRWHIDELTTRPHATVVAAVLLPNATMTECELNMTVGRLLRGSIPAPGFGASDCRARCPGHLWKCGGTAHPSKLAAMLLGSPALVGKAIGLARDRRGVREAALNASAKESMLHGQAPLWNDLQCTRAARTPGDGH
jgi:Uri superfamily endonuclease